MSVDGDPNLARTIREIAERGGAVADFAADFAVLDNMLWGRVYEATRAEVRQGAAPNVLLNMAYIKNRTILASLAGDETEVARLQDLSRDLEMEYGNPSLIERGR